MTITGELPGDSAPETLLAMTTFNTSNIEYIPLVGAYAIGTAVFTGSVVSANLKSEFGLATGQTFYVGMLFASFSGTPGGGNAALDEVEVNLMLSPGVTPEPASVVMVTLGLVLLAPLGIRHGHSAPRTP